MARFNIKDKVTEVLELVGLPYGFAAKDEGDDTFIVYNTTSRPFKYYDDEKEVTEYKITINLFSKYDFSEYEEKVKDLMLDNGFLEDYYPHCIFIESMGVYNQPLYFKFYYEGE